MFMMIWLCGEWDMYSVDDLYGEWDMSVDDMTMSGICIV